jgi:CRISPR-associated endoribonuclease Cas6
MSPIEVAAFDFRFRARAQMRMPGYMGSAWRGGFGRALKRAVCITGLPVCPGCPFEASCIYPYLFETAPGGEGGILAGYDRVPNPFVLAPPWDEGRLLPEGGETGLRLTLIGRAVEHAGFARQAAVEAGLRGLGPDRGALDLVAVDSVALPPTPPCPERVEIALLTPLRLVEAGRLVGPAALRPRHVLLSLLRRVSTLAERHGPASLGLDYRALKERAETAQFDAAEVTWVEWARWSGRQQALIRMGGLLGSLALSLAGLEPFWPFLALAPWVHVGKGATMGLGAMRVVPA